jgi:predicted ATP-grasp superfamily ATP-dependent carboligase
MGYYGVSCTEFKKDPRDGIYKLMEVNGRHSQTEFLDSQCGINFPWLEYKHLIQGEAPSAMSYRTGVYWIHLTTDVGYSMKYFSKEGYSLRKYIRPYLAPHVFAILDLRDPRPFLKRCTDMMRQAVHILFTRVWRQQKAEMEPKSDSSLTLESGRHETR